MEIHIGYKTKYYTLDSFLQKNLSFQAYEEIKYYEPCIITSEKENKAFKFIIIDKDGIMLSENPPKQLVRVLLFKDFIGVKLEKEKADFLTGFEKEDSQHVSVQYLTNFKLNKKAKLSFEKVFKDKNATLNNSISERRLFSTGDVHIYNTLELPHLLTSLIPGSTQSLTEYLSHLSGSEIFTKEKIIIKYLKRNLICLPFNEKSSSHMLTLSLHAKYGNKRSGNVCEVDVLVVRDDDKSDTSRESVRDSVTSQKDDGITSEGKEKNIRENEKIINNNKDDISVIRNNNNNDTTYINRFIDNSNNDDTNNNNRFIDNSNNKRSIAKENEKYEYILLFYYFKPLNVINFILFLRNQIPPNMKSSQNMKNQLKNEIKIRQQFLLT